jgi:hypothetical protein
MNFDHTPSKMSKSVAKGVTLERWNLWGSTALEFGSSNKLRRIQIFDIYKFDLAVNTDRCQGFLTQILSRIWIWIYHSHFVCLKVVCFEGCLTTWRLCVLKVVQGGGIFLTFLLSRLVLIFRNLLLQMTKSFCSESVFLRDLWFHCQRCHRCAMVPCHQCRYRHHCYHYHHWQIYYSGSFGYNFVGGKLKIGLQFCRPIIFWRPVGPTK